MAASSLRPFPRSWRQRSPIWFGIPHVWRQRSPSGFWFGILWRHSFAFELAGQDRIDDAPAVPGGDRTVRSEPLPFGLHLARLQRFFEPVRGLPALTHAIVVHRPDIQSAQLEHEEH